MIDMENPLMDEEETRYIPILSNYISVEEALARINARYALIGMTITKQALWRRINRGRLKAVRFNERIFLDPEEVERSRFRVPKEKLTRIEPVHITSTVQLNELARKYGPLVEIQGFIEEIERITGIRYSPFTIKTRRRSGTILTVGYTGTPKCPNYWFPLYQLAFINFSYESAKKQQERRKRKKAQQNP